MACAVIGAGLRKAAAPKSFCLLTSLLMRKIPLAAQHERASPGLAAFLGWPVTGDISENVSEGLGLQHLI